MLWLLLLCMYLLVFVQADLCDGTTISLDLIGQGLTVLPDLSMCTALRTLNLQYNLLVTLPPEIGQMTNLQSLVVNNNQLTSLPVEFGLLSNLLYVNLAYNRLAVVPAQLGQLVTLRALGLDNNQLTSLPSQIGNLVNLFYLNLHSNMLGTLPEEVDLLVNLRTDGLDTSQFSTTPAVYNLLGGLGGGGISISLNPIVCLPQAVREHVGWNLHGYQMCSPTASPTISPTNPTMPTINTNETTSVNPTTVTLLMKPVPMRSRLPPFTELYDRANTPVRKRDQSTTGSPKYANNAQSGDEIKSKINEMRKKVAVMRAEL
jgi:hypothetical protein